MRSHIAHIHTQRRTRGVNDDDDDGSPPAAAADAGHRDTVSIESGQTDRQTAGRGGHRKALLTDDTAAAVSAAAAADTVSCVLTTRTLPHTLTLSASFSLGDIKSMPSPPLSLTHTDTHGPTRRCCRRLQLLIVAYTESQAAAAAASAAAAAGTAAEIVQ